MIRQGKDGLSRGDPAECLRGSEDMLSHVPLHLNVLERQPHHGVGGKLAGTRSGYQLAHAGRLVLSGTCKGLLCLDTSPMCGRCSIGTVSKSLPQKTTAHPPCHCTSFDDCQMAKDVAENFVT
jgi:hypothetical protein